MRNNSQLNFMKHELAIIIPAYKSNFFDDCLMSIAQQSVKHFHVYVGDDASPDNIKSVCNKYNDLLDITYHRFDINLGKENLVAHWTRCISLTNNESWVWLFCDDDIMAPNCVEMFYNETTTCKDFDVYRYNTCRIDECGKIVKEQTGHPALESSFDFAFRRLAGLTDSFVSEYIFSRKVYGDTGGFVNFPLAWASDDASWIKFGKNKGIKRIDGSIVYWRQSGINISTRQDGSYKKLLSASLFCKYLDSLLADELKNSSPEKQNEYIRLKRRWYINQKNNVLRLKGPINSVLSNAYLYFKVR